MLSLGTIVILLYINDFPIATNKLSMPILFAHDTSLVITDSNSISIAAKLSSNLQTVYKWFKSNLLSINLSKTYCMQLKTKNTVSTNTILACNNIVISEVSYLKFLGLIIDDTLSWNLHTDKAMKKLTSVCYMVRAAKPYMSSSSLIMMLTYGIVFWGTSTNTDKLCKLQERVIRIMTGQGVRTSCRDLFKEMQILPLKSQYIFSILLFIIKIKKLFISNYDSHNIRT
jgi:hypothetical protein